MTRFTKKIFGLEEKHFLYIFIVQNCPTFHRGRECYTLIRDASRNLVPVVQFKKRVKHPWRSDTFIKVAKLTLLHGCFHVLWIVRMVSNLAKHLYLDRPTKHTHTIHTQLPIFSFLLICCFLLILLLIICLRSFFKKYLEDVNN